MSNKQSRFGLRSREKLKLRSQKICDKCKRNFFPSTYSEYVFDIENDEICNDCNAVQKAVQHSKPSLPSIAQQSSKTSATANNRLLNVRPAFVNDIPTAVSKKTRKTGDNTASTSSTVEMANVQTKKEFKGTIKFERATKSPAASRSIELSSVTRMISDPNEEYENAEPKSAAISFESIPPLDLIDNSIAALPVDSSNNNRAKSNDGKKPPQKIIPKKTNKSIPLKGATTSVVHKKKSLPNIQPDEQICSTKNSKPNTKSKCASTETPVTTRVGTRIRKKSVPFDLNWSSTSASNEHKEQTPPAKRAKIKRTSTNTQPTEVNTEPEIEPVPIDQIKMELIEAPTNRVDILNMVIVHSRLHPSKEKEITSSETLTVRPMDIKQEPIVKETNAIDLDIQQDDSINTLRQKFPKASQYELEYLLFLSKGKN